MAATSTPPLQRDVRPEPDGATPAPAPQLAGGVELIGKYEDSGFKEEPYIARRADGQVVQMPRLLYLVAESIDGNRGYPDIAARVSEAFGRRLDADGAHLLAEEKLRPLGIVAEADGSTPELPKVDPLLALKMKTAVVPERAVNAVAKLFTPLFLPMVVVLVLATFVALDVWLFAFHGVAQSVRQTLYEPLFILLLLGLVVVSAAFHECGHATACAYSGARPGAMGVGIYIVWPAFYTDVTDAYRLRKSGRLRTDLGGVYFNSIFSVATFGAYFLTGWEPLLIVVPIQIMEMLHQFLPFIRLDGYYIVSDLTGVPDMFSRITPTLKSLNPLDETPHQVRVLKPWVRGAVTLYVFSVVPLLVGLLGLTAVNLPRVLTTAWDSMLVQNLKLHHHVAARAYTPVFVDAIQMAVLALPVAGLLATFWKLGRTVVSGLWARTEGRQLMRGLLVASTVVLVFGAAYTWLPNGDYRAIGASDRGTLGAGIGRLASIPNGRPFRPPPPHSGDSTTTVKTTPKQRRRTTTADRTRSRMKPTSTMNPATSGAAPHTSSAQPSTTPRATTRATPRPAGTAPSWTSTEATTASTTDVTPSTTTIEPTTTETTTTQATTSPTTSTTP
jgi:putative peptide zinc metalloprotease protein